MLALAALTRLATWAALSMWAPGPRLVSESTTTDLADVVGSRDGPGALWVGPLPGNGGRDVVIYRPPAWRPADDTTVVVHFHGTYGERMGRKRADRRKREYVGRIRLLQVLAAIDELQAAGTRPTNVALVYPVSAGKRKPHGHRGWWNYDFDAEWMTPDDATGESLPELFDDAKKILDARLGVATTKIHPTVLAEGHSAGGVALLNVAWDDRGLVSEYLFLDAAFEGWADGAHDAIRRHRTGARMTLVTTEGGIADPLRGRTPWCEHARDDGGSRWSEAREWCEGLRADMRDVPDVYLHYTRVRHGEQPRTFAGGLGLPNERFSP